jgi:hypothetical protein
VSQQTTNRTFDEMARALASGSISRGRALRLMGAALVGGTLGLLGVGGVAGADPPGCKRNGKHCKRKAAAPVLDSVILQSARNAFSFAERGAAPTRSASRCAPTFAADGFDLSVVQV